MAKNAHNISLVNSTPAIYQPRTRNFDGSTKICQMETLNSSNEMMNDTHCAKLNTNEKKPKQVPIQLPNIARTLSDAKSYQKK